MKLTTDQVNWLNIGLMVLAALAAIVAPVHVFLFAYAVLGPLHYVTEISWLHDRDYFTPRKSARRSWLVLTAFSVAAVAWGYFSDRVLHRPVPPTFEIATVYLAFVGTVLAARARHPVNAAALLLLSIFGLALFSGSPAFGIGAYLLVTIVHVLVFTGAFVLLGALKTRSRSGLLSFGVFAACVVATLALQTPFVAPAPGVRAVYALFEQLNRVLLFLAGRRHVGVYDAAGIGVMRLVAFAYLYHYLNWFSKTSIIRWHAVSRRRAAAIVAVWLAGVALYLVNYEAGFALLYVLSVAHVVLEFPLNHQAFSEIIRLTRLRRPASFARSS